MERDTWKRSRHLKLLVSIYILSLIAIALLLIALSSNQWYVAPVEESQWTEDEISETVHIGLLTGEIHFQFVGDQEISDEWVLEFVYSDSENLSGTDFTETARMTYWVLIAGLIVLGSFLVFVLWEHLAPRHKTEIFRLAAFIIGLVTVIILSIDLLYFVMVGIPALHDDNWDYFDWNTSGFGTAFWMSVIAVVLIATSVTCSFARITDSKG